MEIISGRKLEGNWEEVLLTEVFKEKWYHWYHWGNSPPRAGVFVEMDVKLEGGPPGSRKYSVLFFFFFPPKTALFPVKGAGKRK